ncbi:hypothetical protein [Hahella ganghwensis]|uniref:hypothetical protein n=1 Tax=Hahella ganghwensis TaxID=286420 RepID=UPI0003816C4A|nr:hypothetical protein [Hahella ganghwensis]
MSDVIAFTSRSVKTLADGTLRLSIDIEPNDAKAAFELFGMPGVAGAVCRLTQQAAQQNMQQKAISQGGQYGEMAKLLKLKGFFRVLDVWRAIGPDSHFTAWIRNQKCCFSGVYGTDQDPVQVAHVRRVANGSGTGIKPPYSSIPLLASNHAKQHQQGESALGGKEWFDKQRIEHVERWAWETLKNTLGYQSMADVPPKELKLWAQKHDVLRFVPAGYVE